MRTLRNSKSAGPIHVEADILAFPPPVRATLIASALPFMQHYEGETIVIKFGGSAMSNETLLQAFARDIALLRQAGVKPVVVHGGGPQIGSLLKRLGIESKFHSGLRVTDAQTIEVVEMVLAGSINKEIVTSISAEGELAIGLCGKDGGMVFVERIGGPHAPGSSRANGKANGKANGNGHDVDLGFVGTPARVNRRVLDVLTNAEVIPVIAPIALGQDGQTYNVNADTFAGAVAGALNAKRLLVLTDVPGVLDRAGRVIKELTISDTRAMMDDGLITGGMIPKVETCIEAIERGVEGVVILNGKQAHAVLLELFTEHGAGTLLVP
jgi:acetylglutamate kinase